jgi:hypothetical protein
MEAGMNSWPVSVTLGHQRLNHQDDIMADAHDGTTFIAITPRGKHH